MARGLSCEWGHRSGCCRKELGRALSSSLCWAPSGLYCRSEEWHREELWCDRFLSWCPLKVQSAPPSLGILCMYQLQKQSLLLTWKWDFSKSQRTQAKGELASLHNVAGKHSACFGKHHPQSAFFFSSREFQAVIVLIL